MWNRACYMIGGVALFTACSGPVIATSEVPLGTSPPPPTASPEYVALRTITEAWTTLRNQYVDMTQPRSLVVYTLQGAGRRLETRGVSVDIADQTVTITHRDPGTPAQSVTLPIADLTTEYAALRVIADAASFLQRPAGLGVDELKDVLIHGLMDVDPQGSYFDRRSYREMQIQTSGDFVATGLEFTLRDGALTVVAPIDGTPASRAGLQPGDRIVKIDGLSTRDVPLPDVAKRMRGSPGSKVTFTVMRDGWTEPRDIDGIVYIKLRQFLEQTPRDLERALAKAAKGGLQGLILDLRNNPGGSLIAAVEVSEMFLDDGRLVVYTEGRVRNQNLRFSAHAKKAYTRMPMVVLVNQGSSAASEIVAGALQDWGRANLLGTQTFGRASIQTIIPLSDGSGLRLTTAKWFTPKGRTVHGKGLTPDLTAEAKEVPPISPGMTAQEVLAGDIQLASAFAHLRSLVIPLRK